MRVVVAALFTVGGIFAAVALVGEFGDINRVSPHVVGLGSGLLLVAMSVGALFLFNPWWANPFRRMTAEDILRQLEAQGLVVSSDFEARRAFGIEESDDEGLHYFLELGDGRVLYLTGQYLYDYEPISDEPELNQPRRFPCTAFTVRRHKTEGCVLEIVCRGTVIEPEFIAPPLTRRRRRSISPLQDGQILSDRPYDGLKDEIQCSPA
ncbi:MAG TPA: hypothetical protein VGM05_03690 [Planctomycetaceae bacterium]|jgi:hypothetical protein